MCMHQKKLLLELILQKIFEIGVSKMPFLVFFRIFINPFAAGDFAEKRVLKLVEWFSGYCRAIKS